VAIRPLEAGDVPPLGAFFAALPEGDVTFIKEDVLDPRTVASWAEDRSARRWIAVDSGAVEGIAALVPQQGWSAHVGEVRLVVAAGARGKGLGRALARNAVLAAISAGLSKIFVEVVADQTAALAMFGSLGFDPEALLRGHIRDRSGVLRDLVVLAHDVGDNWSSMSAAGLDDVGS